MKSNETSTSQWLSQISKDAETRVVPLSDRELDVLRLVADGHRNKAAANILFISKRTVDFHLATIYLKLGVSNRVQAVRAAWSLGLIPMGSPGLVQAAPQSNSRSLELTNRAV